jgi:hypothetical protein
MQQKAARNRREQGLGLQQILARGEYPETTIESAAV